MGKIRKIKFKDEEQLFAICPYCKAEIEYLDDVCTEKSFGVANLYGEQENWNASELVGHDFFCPKCDKEVDLA